jgi:glycosyltransferase involved in cell wall biosynthesis
MHDMSCQDAKLSMVCPCYDEAEVIRSFYDKLRSVLDTIDKLTYEIIFVDDGSSDGTLKILNSLAGEDPRVLVCSLSRNFGHQIALTAGLDYASGDAVIMMDTDLQHPPDLIPEMVKNWRAGYDIVSGVRDETAGTSWFKNITSKGFYTILNTLSRTRIPTGVADFNLLSRPVYEALRGMRERHRFVRGMISWLGFSRTFVYYRACRRPAGRSKYTLYKMMTMATDAVFSFSSTPLLVATRIGIVITMLGFVYLLWIFFKAVFTDSLVVGWASLIAVMLILGGCQLLFIGLIGQYLARVFDEAKGRPIYVLKQAPPRPAGRVPDPDLDLDRYRAD